MLRANFLIPDLFQPGEVALTYTHYDRMIVGGATPLAQALALEPIKQTGTKNFLDRRELIVINIGGAGTVTADGQVFATGPRDMVYVGMGTTSVSFGSDDIATPAKFYLLSAPAHATLPAKLIRIRDAKRVDLGSQQTSNERFIFQFVHPEGREESCQLVVGLTQLARLGVEHHALSYPRPAHGSLSLFRPRLECPCVPPDGELDETRHLVMKDEEAVVSPCWSIHSGAGTSSYAFIWAMAGDNFDYTDVDPVPVDMLR